MMSFYLSATLSYIFISHCCHSVYSISVSGSPTQKISNSNTRELINSTTEIVNNTLLLMDLNNANEDNETQVLMPLVRVKKDSGAGKFTQAAKMDQLKTLRVFLQLFKNFWDDAYVGGSHPLHPNVPKAIVALYKMRIVDFFFPRIGDDPKMNGK